MQLLESNAGQLLLNRCKKRSTSNVNIIRVKALRKGMEIRECLGWAGGIDMVVQRDATLVPNRQERVWETDAVDKQGRTVRLMCAEGWEAHGPTLVLLPNPMMSDARTAHARDDASRIS